MTKFTLITGASQGIGFALAKEFAEHNHNLILVSRSYEKLNKAKQNLLSINNNIEIKVFAYDLALKESPKSLNNEINNENLTVNVLVNNAGFGGNGKFYSRDFDEFNGMIDLNIKALVNLTRLFLPDMINNNDGKILNISSTAGFLPGPNMSIYYATKAFVNSFSQAISDEVKDTGVSVTALCPGPVDTGFAERGGVEDSLLFKFAIKPDSVAKKGYKALVKGKSIKITNPLLSFLLRFIPLLPRKLVTRISAYAVD